MKRIEKIDAIRGAAIALAIFASSVLAGCADDPSPHTYLDWHVAERETHHAAARERERDWPAATYYTVVVRPHDTIATVAARYDVSQSSVRRLNDIGARSSIHAGDVLRIPPGTGRTRETVLREVASPRIYAEPHDSDYVEEHQLSAPDAPVRVARAEPRPSVVHDHEEDTIVPPSDAMHFVWPVEGHVVLNYGEIGGGERNDGINIATAEGTPVRAAAAGVVSYAGNELRQYGNLIIIRHADGFITVYAHEARIGVKKGDRVAQGQQIGTAGATGGVDRPELHFEVRYQTKPVNPRPLLSQTVARASS